MTRGPLKGKDFVTFISDMTKHKWERGAKLLGVKTAFGDSSRSQQKEVLLSFQEDVGRQKMYEASAAAVEDDEDTGS